MSLLSLFCKQFLFYIVHIDRCYHAIHKHSYRSQHISVLTTSGMHRRLFECRHLVLLYDQYYCNYSLYIVTIFTAFFHGLLLKKKTFCILGTGEAWWCWLIPVTHTYAGSSPHVTWIFFFNYIPPQEFSNATNKITMLPNIVMRVSTLQLGY